MTTKTGFDEALADARTPDHRNYSPELYFRIRAEKRMATALVTTCLQRGYTVSVNVNRPGFAGGSNFPIGWSHDEQNDEQVFP